MSDSLLKAFPLQLVFRGVFPGGFFVLSFLAAHFGWEALQGTFMKNVTGYLLLAVFAGVVTYVGHRSLVYPVIECFLTNGTCKCAPISRRTVNSLVSAWRYGAKPDEKEAVVGRHLTAWNDYIHLQYASAICIALGALIGRTPTAEIDWCLVVTGLILFGSALVSDLRRLAVLRTVLRESRREQ